ncbi:MAG TPA: FAD-binding oxidoreductase, partial [Candidatus Saccharibacteria bacterium]|nr:FAD-binding oxidoreductase [Candidatus Saccharibacteria bacterium]
MNDISETLKTLIKGDLDTSEESRELFSHDASMFEMKPQVIIAPKDSQDIQNVVSLVAQQKASGNDISITARSAGTDMSGGAIGESIIFDMRKYMNKIGEVSATEAKTQPGVLYRDFEVETLKFSAIMPSYPASRDLCSVGGMVANNSGGEKSLEFGKTEEFVKELKVVFSDGKEYSVRPLNKTELDAKIAQNDFEGSIYKRVFDLVDGHYDEIK